MNFKDISTTRLYNQQVLNTSFTRAGDLVNYMGAMQAQDYRMAKWAIGARLPGINENTISEAIASGEILRTHVMRPTWHFVSAEDIYWMLELTAPRIRSGMKGRHQRLGLTKAIINKSYDIIIKALEGNKHCSRDELVGLLAASGIDTKPADNRASHIMLTAELDTLVCSGADKNNKPTYALLEERVPVKNRLSREEALSQLAGKYFRSHGPASIRDFSWWSGLSLTDARKALQMIKKDFEEIEVDGQAYWFSPADHNPDRAGKSLFLLPAYDEFLISYADRSASLPSTHNKNTISNNGIFRPLIVENAHISGIWKISTVKNKYFFELSFFNPKLPGKAIQKQLELETRRIGQFFGKESEVNFRLHSSSNA